jgi:hypothetical protein
MTLIAVVGLALFYNIRVYHIASPSLIKLDKVAKVAPQATFAQVIERPLVIRNEDQE